MYRLIIMMAWKNSFLRLSRTLLLISMIAVSMSMMLGIQGLYDGMTDNMIDKNRRSASGDITIYAKEYRVDRDLKHAIKDAQKIKKEIEEMKGEKALVLRLRAEGLLSTARKSSFASMYGISLEDEEHFGRFSEFLKEGEMDLKKRGAVIGLELAKRLKVKIGSKLVFSTQDSSGEINSISLRIKAIVQTTNIALDTKAIFIDIKTMQTFLGLSSSEATQISIISEDKNLYSRLTKKYPQLDVKSFFQLQPMMKQVEDMMLIFNSITFFIVMMVVFVGIFGLMYVSILDRIREFGISLGIGMQYRYIRSQIILEALILGLLGYLAGALLGTLILIYLRDYGLDLSAFSDALEMWGYEDTLHATLKVSYFTMTFTAIISASLLSVIIPLRKIKRLNPIDVIKAEK